MNEKSIEERISGFIRKLHSYTAEGREDRAALAALRRGLTGKPGDSAAQYPYVIPFLSEYEEKDGSDKWFFLVGALFAWHPLRGGKKSLGAAFRELKHKEGASESIEKRFVALLASDERDLHLHLRQAIGLLRANDVPVNWSTLLRDLTLYGGWSNPQRNVQMQWARDYYSKPSKKSNAADGSTPAV